MPCCHFATVQFKSTRFSNIPLAKFHLRAFVFQAFLLQIFYLQAFALEIFSLQPFTFQIFTSQVFNLKIPTSRIFTFQTLTLQSVTARNFVLQKLLRGIVSRGILLVPQIQQFPTNSKDLQRVTNFKGQTVNSIERMKITRDSTMYSTKKSRNQELQKYVLRDFASLFSKSTRPTSPTPAESKRILQIIKT